MNGARLTAVAERAGERYGVLLGAFQGILRQFSSSPNPGSVSVRNRAKSRAYAYAEGYLETEVELISQAIEQELQNATVDTLHEIGTDYEDPSEAIAAHAASIGQDLEHAIRTQLERDVSSVGKGLRDLALRGQLVAKSRGIPTANALALLRDDVTKGHSFTFQDRASRHWPSQKFIRTLWRHALVLTWNETAALTMAARGVPSAVIEHPDTSNNERGTIISLGEETTGITWDQVRDDVFHPNSNAWLKPVV
jgi:hypothetical protein